LLIPSRTTTSLDLPILTGTPTGGSGTLCCAVRPNFVGLGQWASTTVTATVATVITQYLQYNNTVVTSTTTVTNSSATGTEALDDLVTQDYCCIYDHTQAVLGTTTTTAGLTLYVSNVAEGFGG
jgi:hypothetical protein